MGKRGPIFNPSMPAGVALRRSRWEAHGTSAVCRYVFGGSYSFEGSCSELQPGARRGASDRNSACRRTAATRRCRQAGPPARRCLRLLPDAYVFCRQVLGENHVVHLVDQDSALLFGEVTSRTFSPESACGLLLKGWAWRDSNPRPTDYEFVERTPQKRLQETASGDFGRAVKSVSPYFPHSARFAHRQRGRGGSPERFLHGRLHHVGL